MLNQLIEKIGQLLSDLNHFYLDPVVNTRKRIRNKMLKKQNNLFCFLTSCDSGGEPLIDVDESNFNV